MYGLDSGDDAKAGWSSSDYVTACPSPREDRNPSKALKERQPSRAQNGFGSRLP